MGRVAEHRLVRGRKDALCYMATPIRHRPVECRTGWLGFRSASFKQSSNTRRGPVPRWALPGDCRSEHCTECLANREFLSLALTFFKGSERIGSASAAVSADIRHFLARVAVTGVSGSL